MIALTGGTGFLGSHVADALLAAGHRVRIAVRPTSDLRWLKGKPLEIQVSDLTSPRDCDRLLHETSQLVHCAGVVTARQDAEFQSGNVQTTECLLGAAARSWARKPKATFLLVSSLAAHGPAPLNRPAVESNPCRPITAYGRSKLAAERAVVSAPGEFRRVVLRPPSLYGPRDREFLPLLKTASRGWTARLGNRLTGLSLVDGRDAAAAIVALLATPSANGVYFVADTNTGYDWAQIREALAAATQRTVRQFELPLWTLRVAARIASQTTTPAAVILSPDRLRDLTCDGWVCDGSRLTAATGFIAQKTAATGFRDTLNFYRKHRWL